jgi:hypothetical protein
MADCNSESFSTDAFSTSGIGGGNHVDSLRKPREHQFYAIRVALSIERRSMVSKAPTQAEIPAEKQGQSGGRDERQLTGAKEVAKCRTRDV